MKVKALIILISSFFVFGCNKKPGDSNKEKLQVVTTTTMITDMLVNIGGNSIEVKGLMGSGVDPHLYKASEGDVSKLVNADVVFYNGLHLEGKLEDIFEKMHQRGKKTIAVSDAVSKEKLIKSENFASNYDPHIWFHTEYWMESIQYVAKSLGEIDGKNAAVYSKNAALYIEKIKAIAIKNKATFNKLPKEKRILITAHDAFNYFGKAYNFQVIGLQGLSTATEAGVQDVQNLSNFIIENKVKAIFIESSVPKRTIEALQASVKAKDHEVKIGGELFSDALGTKGTKEGTYIGMFQHNVQTIFNALN